MYSIAHVYHSIEDEKLQIAVRTYVCGGPLMIDHRAVHHTLFLSQNAKQKMQFEMSITQMDGVCCCVRGAREYSVRDLEEQRLRTNRGRRGDGGTDGRG